MDNQSVLDLLESTDKKYYVESNRFDVTILGEALDKDSMAGLLSELKELSIIEQHKVYAVPKSNVKLIKDFDSNWIKLETFLTDNKEKIRLMLYKNARRQATRALCDSYFVTRVFETSTFYKLLSKTGVSTIDLFSHRFLHRYERLHKWREALSRVKLVDTSQSHRVCKAFSIDEKAIERVVSRINLIAAHTAVLLNNEKTAIINKCPVLEVGLSWFEAGSNRYSYTNTDTGSADRIYSLIETDLQKVKLR